MDADLKARLVSTEELSLAIGSHFEKVDHRAPVAWWDRSCDIALLIGTFIHGLGNYDAMLNDDALPFAFKIRAFAGSKDACVAAHQRFNIATTAARKVFDDALEAYMEKDRQKTLVKVAEAHKASADIESNAKALREGGAAADAVLSNMPEEVPNVEIDEDDSDYVTLPRLKSVVCSSLRNSGSALTSDMDVDMPAIVSNDAGNDEESTSKRKSSSQHLLSMPDARILDYRLHLLFSEIERNAYPAETSDIDVCNKYVPSSIWPKSDTVSTNCQVLSRALSLISDANIEAWGGYSNEYMGIGVNGTQCGLGTGDNKSNSNNPAIRSLDDGTDYSIGAASPDLAQVANGVSSHRYNRAIGVPMNLTRYALSALVHASESNVDQALAIEQACSNVNSEETTPGLIDVKKEETEASPLDKSETPKPEAINSEEAEKKPRMPEIFEVNAALRASICTVVLNYGFPFKTEDELKVSMPIWNNIREQCGQVNDAPPDCLFTAERFMSLIKEIAGDMDIPDFRMIKEYVEISLLPHCLRLCVVGNGPNITNNSRWSYGNYVTANGTSLYQEHTENLQTPIPDPCLPLVEHSLRALALANAILRRVRLMRTLFDIATGKLPSNQLDDALRSSSMRKSMGGLPVWWCPWIHDAALLVHASTRGLFSIMKDRNSEDSTPLAFSREIILQHMYSTFVAVDNALPSSVVDNSPPEDSQTWIEQHAHDFPTLNVLERRLAFLCAKATEHLDGEERFENLPMFDHGGWPRN